VVLPVHLSASNVSGLTVTLPVPVQTLIDVQLLNTGNYPNSSAVAPVDCTIVTTSPTAANQVQLTSPTQLTFGTGTTLDTTYGTLMVRVLTVGQGQPVQ
jgi:hypothetical protein